MRLYICNILLFLGWVVEVLILQFVNNSSYFPPFFWVKFSETVVWCLVQLQDIDDGGMILQPWDGFGDDPLLILGLVCCGGGCCKEETIFSEIWNIQMPCFAVLWEFVPCILLCSLRLQQACNA